jgi:hypothetical protein
MDCPFQILFTDSNQKSFFLGGRHFMKMKRIGGNHKFRIFAAWLLHCSGAAGGGGHCGSP